MILVRASISRLVAFVVESAKGANPATEGRPATMCHFLDNVAKILILDNLNEYIYFLGGCYALARAPMSH